MVDTEMTETEDYDKSAIPIAHHASHEDAGSDEMDVSGLVHKSTCCVYLSVNQPINDLSYTLIGYDTKLFDRNNDFSLVTHRFTAPADGKYYLCAQAIITDLPADKILRILGKINGSTFIIAENYPPITANVSVGCSKIIDMSENDYFDLYVYHNHDPSRLLFSGFYRNFICVTRLY